MADEVIEDNSFVFELENALKEGCDLGTLRNICKNRPLASHLRPKIWQICLNVSGKADQFSGFDELYDLPEQALLREDCQNLVDKLGNEDEEKLSVASDLESILTLYCKSRNVKYTRDSGWTEILQPLLALRYSKTELYNVFYAIVTKFVPRDCVHNGKPFHLFRLLLLYHDPELCGFLDTKRVSPDLYAYNWFSTLFASHCDLKVILNMWDVYLQLGNQFLVFFMALVILVNARDQLLTMGSDSKQDIVEKLSSFPSALEANDIEDFCSLAQYYASRTPQSLRQDFHDVLFGMSLSSQKAEADSDASVNQALCLTVSVEELLQSQVAVGDCIRYFLVDCRPAEQYNVGHLPTAFHLDANLMLQSPSEFATAVQALLATQEQAINSNALTAGEHLCFIGSGREQEDQYTFMVIAHFLQRHSLFVSVCAGGYSAIHNALQDNLNIGLADHQPRFCIVCNVDSVINQNGYDGYNICHDGQEESLINKFEKFSSVFKSKSAIVKEKMINYIKNEQAQAERHVSSSDKVGKRYRNMASVFSIGDDEEEFEKSQSSDDEQREVVNIGTWTGRTEVKSVFECQEVTHSGFMHQSFLCVTDSHLYVLRVIKDQKGMAWIQSRKMLGSILKITSKKRHPEFITFKYGSNNPEAGIAITAIDRFIIAKAGEATKFIKQQIMKVLEASGT